MLGLGLGLAGALGLPGVLGLGRAGMSGDEGFFGNIGNSFNDWASGRSAYTELGGPEDISQVNPYTDQFYQQISGNADNVWNQMMGGMGQQNQFWPGMQEFMGGIDPTAAQEYFVNNAAGDFRNIAEENFADYNTANQAIADRFSNQAVQNISSQFADRGPGGLRSGGAMQAISEGAINPLLQSNAQIAQMIGGQAGQLQGQGLAQLNNAYNTANQQQLQGWGQLMGSADTRDLAQQQLLGSLYSNLLGQQGQIAAPAWYQQQYADNPNFMGMGDILNLGGQIAGMFAGGGGGIPGMSGGTGA